MHSGLTLSCSAGYKKGEKKDCLCMIDQLVGLFVKEFEDTKGAIRIPISKKNRQHNGQKKKY
jgi:hypothetical protein